MRKMEGFKTLRHFLNSVERIQNQQLSILKEFEKLSDKQQYILGAMCTDIKDSLDDFYSEYKEGKNESI